MKSQHTHERSSIALIVTALLAAGCSSGSGSTTASSSPTTAAASPAPTNAAFEVDKRTGLPVYPHAVAYDQNSGTIPQMSYSTYYTTASPAAVSTWYKSALPSNFVKFSPYVNEYDKFNAAHLQSATVKLEVETLAGANHGKTEIDLVHYNR